MDCINPMDKITFDAVEENGSIINGNELETLSFSNLFGFPKINGTAFTFDNTGPALRYANLLVWHPLFNLTNTQMIDYFDSYTNIGYLMTDSSNVSGLYMII